MTFEVGDYPYNFANGFHHSGAHAIEPAPTSSEDFGILVQEVVNLLSK